MKLNKATHKAFLYRITNLEGNEPRRYLLDELDVAMSVSKKLAKGSEVTEQGMIFKDGEVEFTPEEWVFLKERFEEIKGASLAEGEILGELKEILSKTNTP